MNSVIKIKIDKEFVILILITVCFLIFSEIFAPGFVEMQHLAFMLEVMAIVGIAAIAQTLVIISGGIDLSVGSIMYLMLAIAPRFMRDDFLLPFLLCLVIGTIVGALNGVLIAWAEIPPVVQTIAMMTALTGFIFVYTGGVSGVKAHPMLRVITVSKIGPLHSCTIMWIILIILFFYIIHGTSYGRYIKALGSNPRASYLSGIKVKLVIFTIYSISGLLSALAGLFFYGYANVPYYPSQTGGLGIDYAFNSITAVLIGGTLFKGGKGGPERTFLGVFIIQTLTSLLVMLGLPQALRFMVNGIVILIVVTLYKRIVFYKL
ncbi:MAG: ABC transporter permease [Candidatus Aenigmatarchaeota archaeon]